MTELEVKAALEALLADVKEKTLDKVTFGQKVAEIEASIKSMDTKAEVAELKTSIAEIKKQAEELGLAMTKLETINFNTKNAKEPTFSDTLVEAFKNQEIKDFLKKGKGSTDKIDLKAAGDMSEGGNLTAGSVLITDQPRRDIIELKTRPIHMRNIMSVGTTTKDRIPVVKQANYEDGADMKAENASSGQSDFDLVETYVNVERLATHMIVSKDMLDDIPRLMSFLANHAPKRIMTKEDQQILFGTGMTPQLQGITGVATAFAAGSFAASIPLVNEIDVLRIALANLTVGYYAPSAVILNPVDVAKIDLLKSLSTREYLGSSYMISRDSNTGLLRIAGIPIIANTAMTVGKYLIGDYMDGAEIVDRKSLTMQISDSHASTFIANQITISFEERIALPIYYDGAFIYGDFDTDKAAISSGS